MRRKLWFECEPSRNFGQPNCIQRPESESEALQLLVFELGAYHAVTNAMTEACLLEAECTAAALAPCLDPEGREAADETYAQCIGYCTQNVKVCGTSEACPLNQPGCSAPKTCTRDDVTTCMRTFLDCQDQCAIDPNHGAPP